MAKSSNYDKSFGDFKDRLKNEQVPVPIQKVVPVEKKQPKVEEEQITVKLPVDLMKEVRMKGVQTRKKLKDMVMEALHLYIKQ